MDFLGRYLASEHDKIRVNPLAPYIKSVMCLRLAGGE